MQELFDRYARPRLLKAPPYADRMGAFVVPRARLLMAWVACAGTLVLETMQDEGVKASDIVDKVDEMGLRFPRAALADFVRAMMSDIPIQPVLTRSMGFDSIVSHMPFDAGMTTKIGEMVIERMSFDLVKAIDAMGVAVHNSRVDHGRIDVTATYRMAFLEALGLLVKHMIQQELEPSGIASLAMNATAAATLTFSREATLH